MDPVFAWLDEASLDERVTAFPAQRFAPDQLRGLTDAQLRELGLSIADRMRLRRALVAHDSALRQAKALAERRPITAVFFDLVDSTPLSVRLDPEDLLETVNRYRDACVDAILRYGGQITEYQGDGIVACFCFPIAHDDDPERAVRAALEAVTAAGRLRTPDGTPIAARAGVATGRVVVGDLFGEHSTAMGGELGQALGSTLNLAARLQALASPGGVVIAAETAARLRGHFALEDLGPQTVRGFVEPVRMFRVLAERPRRVRPYLGEARVSGFVGREVELALLHALWSEALDGRGGAVLVRGEAGIGKSRLARRFLVTREARYASSHFAMFGSPFHGDDTLWPAAAALRGLLQASAALDLARDLRRPPALRGLLHASAAEAPPDALHGLRRLLLRDGTDPAAEARLAALAELLGFAQEHEAAHLRDATPSRLKALTLDALVAGVTDFARTRPLLLLVEDAHWFDPTTLELVGRLVAEASEHRVLVLLTAREEFALPAGDAWAAAVTLDLKGLGEADATSLFAAVSGGAAAPQLGRNLAARTGGVPLFVEEFARTVTRSGGSEAPAIPATLHECLTARLDRAGWSKAIAQAAAVLDEDGVRTGPLAMVTGLPEPIVKEALVRLEAVGLLERRQEPAGTRWCFHHALLRETAYDSMLRDRRRMLHGRAADTLGSEAPPAILAHHLSEAGRLAESVPFFLAAARRSLARSAQQEAARLLRRGLAALDALPVTAASQEQRLELMELLGPALMGLHGPGSPEAQALYANAVALARSLPSWKEHFPIFWGWWRLSHLQDFNESRTRAAWLYAEVRNTGDRGLLLQAHHCNWAALHNQGELRGSAQHITDGLALYREAEHGEQAVLYGNHDARVCGHAYHALGLWQRGLAHMAETEEAHAIAWAQHLGHVGSVLHALELAMVHRAYRRNPQEVRAAADRLSVFAEEHDYSHYRTRSRICHGWAMAMLGDARQGATLAAEALAIERDVNTSDDFAVFHCLVAEAWAAAGEPDRALAEISAAQAGFQRIGLYHWAPEVWRTIGDLTLRVAPTAVAKAARAYAKAGRLASQQGAHRLALRAAVSAARLASNAGRQRYTERLAAAWKLVREIEEGAAELHEVEVLTSVLRGSAAVTSARRAVARETRS
jgi:predicted ATPase/class 3 adenylate cyclase